MKKICVLTGTRAEYGLLRPSMGEIEKNPDLKLSIIATGTHLSNEFGYTIDEITKDGFKIDEKPVMNQSDDTGLAMAHAIGDGINNISESLARIEPDILLIL